MMISTTLPSACASTMCLWERCYKVTATSSAPPRDLFTMRYGDWKDQESKWRKKYINWLWLPILMMWQENFK
ncbi:hypothetical protein RLOC_00007298 [Lonchura striata]|uniref:Uncharacterized protein n=1 Tax=Lonchura striata TaxID=40157 RepID=A0A218VBJ1_9PASE|nr:hypothetical protein RLOC_00007298 [Lonchura striata domestica]